jgi:large subunit ribosomal protein L20
MPRAIDGRRRRTRRKKILRQAKGFWGGRRKLFRVAKGAVAKAGLYAYRDRKARKGEFRSLWVTRISAICRQHGTSYSEFMQGLRMAIEDPAAFEALLEQARSTLGAPQK